MLPDSVLSQLKRKFTEQPPHSKFWAGTNSESDAADQPEAQGNEVQALVLKKGDRVEALFDVEGSRKWFGGVVVAQNANDGLYRVKFDDDEEADFAGDNHASLAFRLRMR
jgi:hypothetical protein